MAKAKKPKNEDPEQSRRFIEAAEAVAADGGRSPTGAEAAFERLLAKAAPAKRRNPVSR